MNRMGTHLLSSPPEGERDVLLHIRGGWQCFIPHQLRLLLPRHTPHRIALRALRLPLKGGAKTGLSLALALVMLAGCGTRKPLIKPKDIPAYEAKRERKKEQLEEDQADAPDAAAEDAAPQNAAPATPAASAP